MEKKIGAKIYKKGGVRRVHCRAHILHMNYSEIDTEQKLYIAFDEHCNHFFQAYFEPDIRRNKYIKVEIEFQLKTRILEIYGNLLRIFLQKLSQGLYPEIIRHSHMKYLQW